MMILAAAEKVESAPVSLGVVVVIAVAVLIGIVLFFKDNW